MRKVPFCDDINSVKCNRRKLKRGDSVLQKTGRHAFFFYVSVVSTVVFGLVVKDFLLFEYRTPTTLHVVQTIAVSRRNANLHFSFFSLRCFLVRIVTPALSPHWHTFTEICANVWTCSLDFCVCVCVVACLHCFVWPFWSGCHSVINHQA